jgi:hypothetical protein
MKVGDGHLFVVIIIIVVIMLLDSSVAGSSLSVLGVSYELPWYAIYYMIVLLTKDDGWLLVVAPL